MNDILSIVPRDCDRRATVRAQVERIVFGRIVGDELPRHDELESCPSVARCPTVNQLHVLHRVNIRWIVRAVAIPVVRYLVEKLGVARFVETHGPNVGLKHAGIGCLANAESKPAYRAGKTKSKRD